VRESAVLCGREISDGANDCFDTVKESTATSTPRKSHSTRASAGIAALFWLTEDSDVQLQVASAI
jgi:hypothetical protein